MAGLDENLAINIDKAYRDNITLYNQQLNDILSSQTGFGLSVENVYETLS